MTAKSPQISVYFPKKQRTEIDAAAAIAGQTVAAFVRDAVLAWMKGPESVVAAAVEPEPELELDDIDVKILELLNQSAAESAPWPDRVEPDASPVAPPLAAVTTQVQGERCYHFDGNDGVTRWHEVQTPCPPGTSWAQRIGAAELTRTLDGQAL